MTTFDEIITPEEREEIEKSVESVNQMLIRCRILVANITDFIDARFDGKA